MPRPWPRPELLLTLLVLLAGCNRPGPGAPTLTLSARIDRSSLTVGEQAQITVELTNTGAGPAQIHALAFDTRSIDMKVTLGGADFPTSRRAAAPPAQATLAPGASATLTVPFPALAVGIYQLELHYHGPPAEAFAAPLKVTVEPSVEGGVTRHGTLLVLETELGQVAIKLDTDDAFGVAFNVALLAASGVLDGARLGEIVRAPCAAVIAGEGAGATFEVQYHYRPDRPPPAPGDVALGRPTTVDPREASWVAAGQQFFVVVMPPPGKAPLNPVFGKVVRGMWVLEKLHREARGDGAKATRVVIGRARLEPS